MATPFDEIYDLALVSFKDYKLDQLYGISVSDFENVLEGYLMKAIPKFDNCKKDLENYDSTTKQFAESLNLREKVILSDLMVIEWMQSKILMVTQMQLSLNDTDFKRYAESQNLKSKKETQNMMREIVNQDMVVYGLKNIDWKSWAGGNFDTQ